MARYGGKNFGRVAPSRQIGPQGRPIPGTTRTDLRYYQERAGQAQSMQKVVGTTSAPSSDHRLTGFTADGYAVWEKQAAPAPAPSGGGGGGGGGGAPSGPSPRELQITKEAEAYRKATEEKLALADQTIAKLSDEQEQRRLAAELQNRLQIQAQASARRGQQQAQLQITGGTQAAQTAGTSSFKRRRDQMRLAPIQSTAGVNVPASSVLNV